MTKFSGGFKYYYNGKLLKDFDEWEKYFKKAKDSAVTTMKNLEVHLDEK